MVLYVIIGISLLVVGLVVTMAHISYKEIEKNNGQHTNDSGHIVCRNTTNWLCWYSLRFKSETKE